MPMKRNIFGENKRNSQIMVSRETEKEEKVQNKENQNGNIINKENNNKKKYSVCDENYKKINLFEFKLTKNTIEYYLNCALKDIIPNNDKDINKISDKYLMKDNNEINININLNLKGTNFSKLISTKFFENNDSSSFNILEYPMPLSEEKKVSQILKTNTYFQEQNQNIIDSLLTELIYLTVPKDTLIYNMEDISNYFYIINKGKVKLIKEKKDDEENSEKKTLINKVIGPWESFGEISFFIGKKREENALAEEDVELYLIDSESCRELLKKNNEIILKEKFDFLNNISIFESLDKISKYNVAQKLVKKEFPPNTKIIKYGDVGDKLYIIKEGIVSCKIGLKEIRKLSNNDYFGQKEVMIL